MKKPKITEGEWGKHGKFTVKSKLNGNPKMKLTVLAKTELERIASARAISAVPEMIDALIQANDYIIENAPDDIYPERLLTTIEQALKKAGVEL